MTSSLLVPFCLCAVVDAAVLAPRAHHGRTRVKALPTKALPRKALPSKALSIKGAAVGLAAHNASHKKADRHKGVLQCYAGTDFSPSDLADCEGKGARCFMRYSASAEGVEMNRYCSSKDPCTPSGFTEYTLAGKTYVAKCCDSNACNGGIPAQLTDGLYWVRPEDDDKQFVTQGEGLTLADFANDETQKFELQSLGSPLEAKFAFLAPGTALEGAKAWSVLEVGPGEFAIFGEDGSSLVGDADAKFTLTSTPSWEVAWVGKKCPKNAQVAGVSTVAACQEACEKDPECVDIIEWDSVKGKCFKVSGKCGADQTTSGGDGYFSFKSKCAFVKCEAASQCHGAGTCDATTGDCSTPFLGQGAKCDDDNALTVEDSCSAGVCVGVNKCAGVSCPAEGECFEEGTCDIFTGNCEPKQVAGGTSCDDGDKKTIDDMCNVGVCQGTDLCKDVTCDSPSTCHFSGVCEAKTGKCSLKAKNKGSTCDDGSKKTKDDTCDENAVCVGVGKCEAIKCRAQGPCFAKGECDDETGMCSNPPADQGLKCDDLSDVTSDDVCDGKGVCAGTDKCEGVTCAADGQKCKDAGTCDHATGSCTLVNKDDGVTCDDGDEVTVSDVCTLGACKGELLCAAVACEALDTCHKAGECDTKTGKCSNPDADDDAACDDGDDFTVDDKCTAGKCMGMKSAGNKLVNKTGTTKKTSLLKNKTATGLRGR